MGAWELVAKEVAYAEMNSGKHKKANGRENLAVAGAAPRRDRKPYGLACLPIWWVRHSVQRAPLSSHCERAGDYHHKFEGRKADTAVVMPPQVLRVASQTKQNKTYGLYALTIGPSQNQTVPKKALTRVQPWQGHLKSSDGVRSLGEAQCLEDMPGHCRT